MTVEQRPLCAECRKPRPLMRDGRCPHCSELHRLAGKPKDMFPSINDEEPTPLRRKTMTITQDRPSETPTMLPVAISDWTGKYKACRECGERRTREVEDGICADCYLQHYGATGLAKAEARRDDGSPAALDDLREAGRATVAPALVECVECRRTIDQATAIRYTSGEWACKDVNACAAAAATPQTQSAPRWHPEFDACLDCGHTDRPYGSRGLCKTCYPATLKSGYTGNAAPPKPPGRRGVETPRLESSPVTPAVATDEASIEKVQATVARYTAQLGIKPEQPAPLTQAEIAKVWIEPLPPEDPEDMPDEPRHLALADGEDLSDFEEFTETGRPDDRIPAMTLRKDGRVTINRVAFDLLGQPARVVILVARDRHILALRAAGNDVPHACKVHVEAKSTRRSVQVRRALKFYGLADVLAQRYEARRFGIAVGVALEIAEDAR